MSVMIQRRRLSKAAATRLLGGEPPADEREARVAAVLAAASASRPSDLDGREGMAREHMAIAGFRDAHLRLDPRPRRLPVLKSTIAKVVTVKVGILVAAILGLGGVALAATSGNLPGVTHSGAPQASNAPASHRPFPSQPASVAPGENTPPGLWWLCNNYIAQDADHRDAALRDPANEDLVERAGGRDRNRVDAFCTKLLERGPDAAATAHPTGGPTAHPGGGPTAHPVPSHPGGRPSAAPGRH